eukprot:SAG11_NODE_27727_length_329_cov_3.047826_1_plen_69_part_10
MRTYTTEESHTAVDICCTALRCCAWPCVIPRCFVYNRIRCFDAHEYHRILRPPPSQGVRRSMRVQAAVL